MLGRYYVTEDAKGNFVVCSTRTDAPIEVYPCDQKDRAERDCRLANASAETDGR